MVLRIWTLKVFYHRIGFSLASHRLIGVKAKDPCSKELRVLIVNCDALMNKIFIPSFSRVSWWAATKPSWFHQFARAESDISCVTVRRIITLPLSLCGHRFQFRG
jgi:hypothetical protein